MRRQARGRHAARNVAIVRISFEPFIEKCIQHFQRTSFSGLPKCFHARSRTRAGRRQRQAFGKFYRAGNLVGRSRQVTRQTGFQAGFPKRRKNLEMVATFLVHNLPGIEEKIADMTFALPVIIFQPGF